MPNLLKHVDNMQVHGISPIVGLNRFSSDHEDEIALVEKILTEQGIPVALTDVWASGGEGGKALAELVLKAVEEPSQPHHLYDVEESITSKIDKIALQIYGADGVRYTPAATKKIEQFESQGYGRLPICIAKTQNSLSDQATLKGRPKGFIVTINDLRASVGAGFIVAYAGNIITMFGMTDHPAAENIDLAADGEITGLF